MVSTKKLKPCPFCGGMAIAHLGYILFLDEDGNPVDNYAPQYEHYIWFAASVGCPKCDYQIEKKRITPKDGTPDGWHDKIKHDAVAAWNRRANDGK